MNKNLNDRFFSVFSNKNAFISVKTIPRCKWNLKELKNLYFKKGKSLHQIGIIYGVTGEAIRQVFSRNGINNLSQIPRIPRIVRFGPIKSKKLLKIELNNCISLRQIYKKYNISQDSLFLLAKYYNLTIPSEQELRKRRFFKKVKKVNDHWIHQGCQCKITGKPRMNGSYKWNRAVDYSYKEFIGPIPKDMKADPNCGEVRCVNPKHLSLIKKNAPTLSSSHH